MAEPAAAAGDRVGVRKRLLVLGVHAMTEAYPNTLHRVEGLRLRYDVDEINRPLWPTHDAGVANAHATAPLRSLVRALSAHASLWLAMLRRPRAAIAYIPYPAPSVAIMLSLLPRARRPVHVVLDGFISLYDAVVNDRGLLKRKGWPARLLWRLERRAFATADAVVVDTAQNAAFYAEIFNLPGSRFVPVPLSTNERNYRPVPYEPRDGRCRVLYTGTLVPLHGIDTIVQAARMLATHPGISFRFIGDGQQAGILGRAIADLPNASWDRRWKSAAGLADEIAEADICLGVFGQNDKTQRVCPLKVYAYAAVGRTVVTGQTRWLREASAQHGTAPFVGVKVGDGLALGAAIAALASDPERRRELATQAEAYYRTHLANDKAMDALATVLDAL